MEVMMSALGFAVHCGISEIMTPIMVPVKVRIC